MASWEAGAPHLVYPGLQASGKGVEFVREVHPGFSSSEREPNRGGMWPHRIAYFRPSCFESAWNLRAASGVSGKQLRILNDRPLLPENIIEVTI